MNLWGDIREILVLYYIYRARKNILFSYKFQNILYEKRIFFRALYIYINLKSGKSNFAACPCLKKLCSSMPNMIELFRKMGFSDFEPNDKE